MQLFKVINIDLQYFVSWLATSRILLQLLASFLYSSLYLCARVRTCACPLLPASLSVHFQWNSQQRSFTQISMFVYLFFCLRPLSKNTCVLACLTRFSHIYSSLLRRCTTKETARNLKSYSWKCLNQFFIGCFAGHSNHVRVVQTFFQTEFQSPLIKRASQHALIFSAVRYILLSHPSICSQLAIFKSRLSIFMDLLSTIIC